MGQGVGQGEGREGGGGGKGGGGGQRIERSVQTRGTCWFKQNLFHV